MSEAQQQPRSTIAGYLDGFAKLAIAAAGLYATWYFNNEELRRNDTRIAAETEARLEDTFARYFALVPSDPTAPTTANANTDVALIVATRAAVRLRDEFSRPDFYELLEARATPAQAAVVRNVALQQTEAATDVVASSSTAAPSADVGATESAEPPAPSATPSGAAPAPITPPRSRIEMQGRLAMNNTYFAVAATYPTTDRASAETYAAQLRTRLSAAGVNAPVELYEPRGSEAITVVVGGQTSLEEAQRLATTMREQNISPDALAQRNRSWGRSVRPSSSN